MALLPLRTVHLASDLAVPALAGLLREVIGDNPVMPFSGSVGDGSFAIRHLRVFRGTAMPAMSGTLSPAPGGGTLVRLRLSPPGVVVVFMAIWLGFLAAVAAMIAAARLLGSGRSLLWLLAPSALAWLSWHVMGSVFAADARWAVEHLLERVPALRRAPSRAR